MNWFKKEKVSNKEKVCGYLDLHGKFYLNESDRDKRNKEILLNEISRKLMIIMSDYFNVHKINPITDLSWFKTLPSRTVIEIADLLTQYHKEVKTI